MQKETSTSFFSTYLKQFFLELLAPAHCVICEKKLYNNEFICKDCFERIEFNEYPLIFHEEMIYYYGITKYKGVMEEVIKKFKFQNYKVLSEKLGDMVIDFTKKHNIQFDIIGFIPMTKKELFERGYNQTFLIAKDVSKKTGVPVLNNIFKVKETLRQSQLSRKEREENIKGAFLIKDETLKDKNVLIVDDVYTTGNTAREISKSFKKNRCKNIYFVALTQTLD